MNYLSAEQLSKSFSDNWLFKDISVGISQGEKFALVGENGAGKSTLLKILTGEIEPDGGAVSIRDGIKLGYLTQQPDVADHLTVKDILFDEKNEVAAAVMFYEACIENPETSGDDMQKALEKMEDLNAWEYEAKIKEITTKLGVNHFDQVFGTLSGGQRKRVFMAQMLLQEPNLIIMDEPTNHLDLEAIEWLENYLSGQQITLIMVTHDRYFLDNVANTILELDRGKLYTYKGNYAYFLEKKSERETMLKTEVSKARNLLKKELEWMRRQPKARGTKAKYRIDAFHELKEKASQDLKRDRVTLDVKETRQGGKIMEITKACKSYGDKILVKDFSYIFKKKDRIGVVGKNGIGKSTFLDLITGKVKPDSGEIIKGVTTKIGYFTQEAVALNANHRVIEEVKEIAEFITIADGSQLSASAFLDLFLFPPEKQYNYVHKLSGGEKKRLQLLKVLITNPNFLILDEPTNDFDIDTLNVLEDFLEKFSGCLVLVSHDRYFMDHLVDELFVFEGDGVIRHFNGNYSDYKELQEEEASKPRVVEKDTSKQKVTDDRSDKKISYAEKKEYESLESEIDKLEAEKNELVELLSKPNTSHEDMIEFGKRIKQLSDIIDEKTLRWLELESIYNE
ncbi:MAG: ABC-F family ATP-binding cassette domain-containing protein [Cyclobacteriaceae bacterium]